MTQADIIGWLVFALGAIGGLLALLRYVNGQNTQERNWREEADDKLNARHVALVADLAAYKLYVAQNHVTAQVLKETEDRLVAAFDRVASRLETIVARLDRLSMDMASGNASTLAAARGGRGPRQDA